MAKTFLAELFGTFWPVLGGCGSAVLAAAFPYSEAASNPFGLGFLGVALAFGLTLLTMAYAIGHISGCHINPAVSFGLWACGRFPGSQLLTYIVAQVLGAIIAGGFLYLVASGRDGFSLTGSNPWPPTAGVPIPLVGMAFSLRWHWNWCSRSSSCW